MEMAGKADFKYNELIKQIIYSVQWIKQRVSTHRSKDMYILTQRNSWGPATTQVLTYPLAYVWQLNVRTFWLKYRSFFFKKSEKLLIKCTFSARHKFCELIWHENENLWRTRKTWITDLQNIIMVTLLIKRSQDHP